MTDAERRLLVAMARALLWMLERREGTNYTEVKAALAALEQQP